MRANVVLVALLLVATLFAPGAAAVADTVTTVDANHGLTERSAIDDYESADVASTALAVPNLRITVAEGHDAVGLSGFRFDGANRYIRFQYNESIERTVRVFIPSEYWHPLVSLDHDAENTDVQADFRPTSNGRYTAVTVTFDGKTDAVFSLSTATSGWFWIKDTGRKAVSNQTGYEPPRIGSGGEWQYVPSDQLQNDTSYPINASAGTLQYDSTPNAEERTWLSVPECSGDNVPVCTFEKSGVDKTFVLAKTEDPPAVRWKIGTDPRAGASSAINDLAAIPDRIRDVIEGVFGGE